MLDFAKWVLRQAWVGYGIPLFAIGAVVAGMLAIGATASYPFVVNAGACVIAVGLVLAMFAVLHKVVWPLVGGKDDDTPA